MEDMEDTVDMEDMVMEKGLLKLMLNQDTDTVVMAMEVMEDTVDMEVMVMEKGPLKQMLNLVITEEAMVATVMEAMAMASTQLPTIHMEVIAPNTGVPKD